MFFSLYTADTGVKEQARNKNGKVDWAHSISEAKNKRLKTDFHLVDNE